MLRILSLISMLMVLLASQQSQNKSVRKKTKKNRAPVIEKFESIVNSVSLCPFLPGGCGLNETHLVVSANDPDGDKLTYTYSVTAGQIVGSGRFVIWNLEKSRIGIQAAHVVVADGHGNECPAVLNVTVGVCGTCDPPPPPCPTIIIECAPQGESSKRFICSAVLEGKLEPYKPPSFEWSVTHGSIFKGQGTKGIEIEVTEVESDLRVTVEVAGFDPSCQTTQFTTIRTK